MNTNSPENRYFDQSFFQNNGFLLMPRIIFCISQVCAAWVFPFGLTILLNCLRTDIYWGSFQFLSKYICFKYCFITDETI